MSPVWSVAKRYATLLFLLAFILDSITAIIDIAHNEKIGGSAFRPAVGGALWFLSSRLDDLEGLR